MIDRPETLVQIGRERANALRSSADRDRMLKELPDELRHPAWRMSLAALLRGLADRLAPKPAQGAALRSSSAWRCPPRPGT